MSFAAVGSGKGSLRGCPAAIFASIASYVAVVAAMRTVGGGTPGVWSDAFAALASAGLAQSRLATPAIRRILVTMRWPPGVERPTSRLCHSLLSKPPRSQNEHLISTESCMALVQAPRGC